MHDDTPSAPAIPPHPDEVLVRFGREVRTAREARGLSRQRFAQRCGLSVGTVKNLERGRGAHPRLETMVRLATGLDVALTDLVACVDPWMTDKRKAEMGAAHVWLAALDDPERDLVLALVRVLTRGPTCAAERVVIYAA
ncbi:MAG: helix-turn-helix transcriptional regulator [Myxococcales bacterium]|nr:helix-turn-helix transcriptional regulator [Myxococcales bacterium]